LDGNSDIIPSITPRSTENTGRLSFNANPDFLAAITELSGNKTCVTIIQDVIRLLGRCIELVVILLIIGFKEESNPLTTIAKNSTIVSINAYIL